MVAAIERIEVRGVTRLFGSTAALRGVSADFERGTISVLEGPNGAGKSTLLAVIGTVLKPTSGRVRYAPLTSDPTAARREIGWVAHDAHSYRDLTVRQNVRLVARLQGVEPEQAWERVSDRVGVTPFADRAVRQLSRGQRQRVALARALLHQPSVLLLDEPWTGLDAASAARLEEIVGEERERGAVVVVVSHDAGLAGRIGARRVRLERGRIVQPAAARAVERAAVL